MTGMMEEGRGLPIGTIQTYGDTAYEMMVTNPEAAQVAYEIGLVDKIVTREELKEWMFQQYPNKEEDRYAFLIVFQYTITYQL